MTRIWAAVRVLIFLLAGAHVQAQVADSALAAPADTTLFDVMFVAEPGDTLVLMRDPAYQAFEVQDTIPMLTEAEVFDTLDSKTYVPQTPADLIEDRLSCLQQEIPLTYNRTVNSFINFFVVRKRNYTQTMLERKDFFFPMFEEALRRYGLPDELKYLSIVESGLNMRAISKSGAVGLWQFMSATGQDFKLYQDKYTDDRMDPRKATEAACRYLRMLYNQFNDWELALAAYNCGPGSIRRTLARTGGRTFWDIYTALPQETRSYVPQFTAVIYAMNYAAAHNLYPDADSLFSLPPADTVVVMHQLDFAALSQHLQVDPKELLHLNPTIRRAISPERVPYVLTLPAEAAARFRVERQCFLDSCKTTPWTDLLPTGNRSRGGVAVRPGPDGVAQKRIIHRVQRGQTLFAVARLYNIPVANLRRSNHLRSSNLHRGQRLIVYKDQPSSHKFKPAQTPAVVVLASANTASMQTQGRADSAVFARKEEGKLAANLYTENASRAVEPSKQVKNAKAKTKGPKHTQFASRTHLVETGDTLWNIARRYKGLTVQRLIELNGLKDKSLKVGQRILIA